MSNFPQPRRLGPATTRWQEAELLEWEQASSSRRIEIPPEAHRRYLRDLDVAERYGISRATVWRWTRNGAA